ncbi:MAG: ABC transporter ATP-binding protein [bacterium]|nr:ABC transporter ATP-binding protein [bacterium]
MNRDGRDEAGNELLRAKGLGKRFGGASDGFWIFRHLDMTLRPSEMVCLSGPSGCGKTTLLALLSGLEKPTEGTVTLMGHSLETMSEARAADVRRKAIGFVFQFFYLLPNLTVQENIALPLIAAGEGRTVLSRAAELASELGLVDRLNRYPRQLSAGEQQRVALARAIISSPAIVMADEPTGNLDASSADVVLSILRRQTQEGRAVLIASHNPKVVEVSDRVIDLSQVAVRAEDSRP